MSIEKDKILYSKMNELVDKYMDKELKDPKVDMVENLSLVFTYLVTLNMAKHSKTLEMWTIVIGVSTVLLFISAVFQLIKLFCSP